MPPKGPQNQHGRSTKKQRRREKQNDAAPGTICENVGHKMEADSKPTSNMTSTMASVPPTSSNPPSESFGLRLPSTLVTQAIPIPLAFIAPHITPDATVTLVDHFFSYPVYLGFPYDPKQPVMPQFDSMLEYFGWYEKSQLHRWLYDKLLNTLAAQFNLYYRMDIDSWEGWEGLCAAIKVHPVPDTLDMAREAVIQSYANVIDLIEHKRIGLDVPVFRDAYELQKYSEASGKFFPSYHACAGPILRCLISYVNRFFAQMVYRAYHFDSRLPVVEQFWEMCEQFGWEKDNSCTKKAYRNLQGALVLEFNALYGGDIDSLETWMGLCMAIGITPIPDTMTKCRTIVARTHVNIIDLIERKRINGHVWVFANVKQLSVYTLETRRIFPKDHRWAGGVLHYLLRHICHPALEGTRDRVAESLEEMKDGYLKA